MGRKSLGDAKKSLYSVYLDPETKRCLQSLADAGHRSFSAECCLALDRWIEANAHKPVVETVSVPIYNPIAT